MMSKKAVIIFTSSKNYVIVDHLKIFWRKEKKCPKIKP